MALVIEHLHLGRAVVDVLLTLRRENPRLDGRVLSVDSTEAAPERFVAHAWRELAPRPGEPREVRRRAGRRETAGLVSLAIPPSQPTRLREGGAYLISGGLGGLGLCFARYLARTYRARLALLGRTTPNEGHERALAELRSLGGEPLYLSVDVSDPAALNEAVAEARARFGK